MRTLHTILIGMALVGALLGVFTTEGVEQAVWSCCAWLIIIADTLMRAGR